MKFKISKLLAALLLVAGSVAVQAQTVTDSNVTITGNFEAACTISGNNLNLGSADLASYMDTTITSHYHTRFPINLGVTCNSGVPWRMYNINPAGVPLTIGAETGNTACIADAAQVGDGYHKCADNTGTAYHGGAYITGTGSETKPVLLLIWYTANAGAISLPWKGTGSISAVVPMRMEY